MLAMVEEGAAERGLAERGEAAAAWVAAAVEARTTIVTPNEAPLRVAGVARASAAPQALAPSLPAGHGLRSSLAAPACVATARGDERDPFHAGWALQAPLLQHLRKMARDEMAARCVDHRSASG